MYERMLNKQEEPNIKQMTTYCGDCADLFTQLNKWLSDTYRTVQEITFPYGNHYGWGIAHRRKKKLICHVFSEKNAFTVMIRWILIRKSRSSISIPVVMVAGFITALQTRNSFVIFKCFYRSNAHRMVLDA